MNFHRAVHQNGHRKPKRKKASKRTPTKPKYTYWDVLRQAAANPDAPVESGTLRRGPVQNTGMVLTGQFVAVRDQRTGMLVFADETGRLVRKP